MNQIFIRNDSDSILDSFLPNNDIADSVQMFINTQVNQNTNSYSKSIIELCNSSQLRILNGRTIGDSVGKATYFNYNGVTINDYCICSASFMKRVVNFQVGSFYPLISDHCPTTVNIFSEYNHSTPQEILRPKPFNLKWTKIVEEQFISNLNNIDLNSISDKIVSFKQKSLDTSISVDDQSEDLNNNVEKFSGILKNAALCTKFKPKNNLGKQKKKRKPNKSWHDDECKVKLRHVNSLCRLLNKSPWNKCLRLQVLYEKKQYNKLLRQKYRRFRAKLLNNMLEVSEKDQQNFAKFMII